MVSELGFSVNIIVGSMNQPDSLSHFPPVITLHSELLEALSMYPFILSKALPSMTAVIKLEKSEASPIFIFSTSATKSWPIPSQTVFGT